MTGNWTKKWIAALGICLALTLFGPAANSQCQASATQLAGSAAYNWHYYASYYSYDAACRACDNLEWKYNVCTKITYANGCYRVYWHK